VFWQITYFGLAIVLTLGGAVLTLFFKVPEKQSSGWRRTVEINRVRIFGFCTWLVGVSMILYGMWLEGWL
jgi:hypothetical protein